MKFIIFIALLSVYVNFVISTKATTYGRITRREMAPQKIYKHPLPYQTAFYTVSLPQVSFD